MVRYKNAVPKKKERRKSLRPPQESDPQKREALLPSREVRSGPSERREEGPAGPEINIRFL